MLPQAELAPFPSSALLLVPQEFEDLDSPQEFEGFDSPQAFEDFVSPQVFPDFDVPHAEPPVSSFPQDEEAPPVLVSSLEPQPPLVVLEEDWFVFPQPPPPFEGSS